jgi:hypothetical protein
MILPRAFYLVKSARQEKMILKQEKMILKGIQVTYQGTVFRSRLEARRAAMLGLIGWHRAYEPAGAAGYIPDFAIAGERPMLAEVKPVISLEELREPVSRVTDALAPFGQDIIFLGALPCYPVAPAAVPAYGNTGPAGFLAGYGAGEEPDSFSLGHGDWITCGICRKTAVYHVTQSRAARPCGHHDGRRHLGTVTGIERKWRLAGNIVQRSRGAPRIQASLRSRASSTTCRHAPRRFRFSSSRAQARHVISPSLRIVTFSS